jgi:hypothetical protein
MISLSDLHDATLKGVNFEWEAGLVHLTFKTSIAAGDLAIVKAEGVTGLTCPRLYPWGPSSSVNEATIEEIANGKHLIVEMQSGDVLEVRCRDVSFGRETGTDGMFALK